MAFVSPELAAAFRPGDRLVVVQETGDLLHVPAAAHAVAAAAVARAPARPSRRMGAASDGAITAFFDAFAARLGPTTRWAGDRRAPTPQDVDARAGARPLDHAAGRRRRACAPT